MNSVIGDNSGNVMYSSEPEMLLQHLADILTNLEIVGAPGELKKIVTRHTDFVTSDRFTIKC